MTDEQINAAIHEHMGLKPLLVEWWAHKDDDTGGSICFTAETKEQVEKWLSELPKNTWVVGYKPKPFYRYPNYCKDLNAMHEAEKVLSEHQKESIYPKNLGAWRNPNNGIYATARQRAEAFLRTLGKWEEVQG